MVEKKAFHASQSINIVYPNVENMILVPIAKGMEIIMSIQVLLISRMNNNYEENGGKKSFSCKPKASICVSQRKEHDCSAHNKKNGDYYKNPSLSHFTDEL